MQFIVLTKAVVVAIIGYLLGSANTSLIVGKFYGIDIRKHGSGNAGMTNTLRTLGKLPALLVIFGDILKGVLSCLIGLYVLGWIDNIGYLGIMTGGIAAIIGHNWPVYFGFKGGKGILTSFAVILMMDWRIGLILFAIFALIVAATRYVSLGSIIASALFPIIAFVCKDTFEVTTVFIVFAFIVGFLAVIRHSSNIERLLKGTESKLGSKKNS